MPESLPKYVIFSQMLNSMKNTFAIPVKPVLVVFMWFMVFPIFVRESLWLSITNIDQVLFGWEGLKWPFTEESVENTVVTFAKYISSDTSAEKSELTPSTPHPQYDRILAVHLVEGVCIFATYLIIAFVIVMVREWIIQHEGPRGLREGAADANFQGLLDPNQLDNLPRDENNLPIELPPVPDGLPPHIAGQVEELRERLQRAPADAEGLRDVLRFMQQLHHFEHAPANPQQAPHFNIEQHLQHHHLHINLNAEAARRPPNVPRANDVNGANQPDAVPQVVPDDEEIANVRLENQPPIVQVERDAFPQEDAREDILDRAPWIADLAHPEVRPFVEGILNEGAPAVQFNAALPDDVLDDDDAGDDLDGIFQFLGIGGPFINVFISFFWIVGGTFLANVTLVAFPYMFARIVTTVCGFGILLLAHITVHLGDIIDDATILFLNQNFGMSLGTVEESSLKEVFFRSPILTYVTQFSAYTHSPHPRSFFNGLLYVLLGAFLITMILVQYVSSSFRFASSLNGKRIEQEFVHVLRHVGDILKVVTITGIELVTFPIFCGILLSGALLPILPNETFYDRLVYTLNHPFDSPLAYWCAGTCYMFQLAIFVTMCRSIMRPGVLYFVRDPNEPNFHPIKEVMDRRLIPQLRKIAISAVMYAILICVCIGGVVWSLRYIFLASFLPLTFDFVKTKEALKSLSVFMSLFLHCVVLLTFRLVFWNFLRPVHIIRAVWETVFLRACAKLRLSSFILNRPIPRERGTVYYGSFKAWFDSVQPDYFKPAPVEDIETIPHDKAIFVLDGVFVRAPATDGAAGKKELKLFIEVNKDDIRVDGLENDETDLKDYTVVYTPPHFRMRVFGLLCVIWAIGGLVVFSVTGLPIIVGRFLLSFVFSSKEVDENNVFAFAVGFIPTLLGICAVDWRAEINEFRKYGLRNIRNGITSAGGQKQILKLFIGALKFLLFSAVYFGIIPLLFIYTLHKFVVEPLNVFMSISFSDNVSAYQSLWSTTLFLLVVFLVHSPSRPNFPPCRIINRIFQNGYMDLDVVFACRVFLWPILSFLVLHFIPQSLHYAGSKLVGRGYKSRAFLIMRDYSYISAITSLVLAAMTFVGESIWRRWETRFRDQVYLVTEQLENLDR